jgi:hypothetical protein
MTIELMVFSLAAQPVDYILHMCRWPESAEVSTPGDDAGVVSAP